MYKAKINQLEKELEENPFITCGKLSKKLSVNFKVVPKYVKKLADEGNVYAKLWIKTKTFRRGWRLIYYVMHLYRYALINKLGTEQIEALDDTDILLILGENKPSYQTRSKKLLNIKQTTLELMRTIDEIGYTLNIPQIDKFLSEYTQNKSLDARHFECR